MPKLALHTLPTPESAWSQGQGGPAAAAKPAAVPALQLSKLAAGGAGSAAGSLIRAHPGQQQQQQQQQGGADPIHSLEAPMRTARAAEGAQRLPSARGPAADPLRKLAAISQAQHSRDGGGGGGAAAAATATPRSGRQPRSVDWGAQLSARGLGTPRSWEGDSGMLRTKAAGAGHDSPPSAAGGGSQGGYCATPRGQLLRSLAAEAAAARRAGGAPAPASSSSYSNVMAAVDGALRSAANSPCKITRAASRA